MTADTQRPTLNESLLPQALAAHPVRAALDESAEAVRAYLFGMTGDWHEAEDLAQAAMLKAWRKRDQFSGLATAKTWIFTIARNHWRDALRSRRRRTGAAMIQDGHDTLLQVAATTPAPADPLLQQELAAAVSRAMATLPDAQREALSLRESDGLTFSQMADILELPVATVKSRVRYALTKLANELSSYREGAV